MSNRLDFPFVNVKGTSRKLIVLSIFVFNSIRAAAQTDWELARNKDGVQVYTKNYKQDGLKQLKAESTIDGISLHTFAAVFKDIDNTKEWTRSLKYAKCLKTISEIETINYFLVNIPWPLRKREGIFKVTMKQEIEDKSLVIESVAFPEYLPETDTVVRILDAKSVWKFTPLSDGKIKVNTIFYADPRGFPPFLVNLFVTDAPFDTMIRLRDFVKQEKYKKAKFGFISE
jgi:hypothetical protein